ncbi:MAG: PKD domain-containing protein [Bacteroidia bacterium]|nr:PKD domain-containing protein [Bacteroidia bacterium]
MKHFFTLMFLTAGLFVAAQDARQNPVSVPAGQVTSKNASTLAKFNPAHVPTAATCDTLNWPIAPSWLPPVNYYTGNFADGWINGPNLYADKEKAQLFNASTSTFTKLHGFFLQFGRAWSANPSKIVTFRVYDGTGSVVGAQIATATRTMGQIMYDVQNNYYTEVEFQTAVNLPASKMFFISVDLTGLTWSSLPKDTLSIVSNSTPNTSPSMVWEKQSDNSWYRYNTPNSWALDISLFIFPYITSQQTLVGFTPNPIPNTCTGSYVNYDAAPSLPYSQLLWNFQGGTPTSATTQTASIQYNTAGTYTTKLYVLGGGCPTLDSMQASILVQQTPTITINPPTTTICINTTTQLTAGGGNSYAWAPASSLSATTGLSVNASPTITTTYTVTGTSSNGCTATGTSLVNVTPLPVASVTTTTTTICDGGSVTFNASGSMNVTTYAWTFTGGSPSSSTQQVPTITYPTPGTYTATLSASNSCGTDNSFSVVINVQNCTNVEEMLSEEAGIHYDVNTGNILLNNGTNGFEGRITLLFMNASGQVVFNGVFDITPGAQITIPASHLANGVYFTEIRAESTSVFKKFVK